MNCTNAEGKKLYIYIQYGDYGSSITVIAPNGDTARKYMANSSNYDPNGQLEVVEILEGFLFASMGDI